MGVAQHARYLDGSIERALDGGLTVDSIAGQHLGHHLTGYIKQLQQVVVPVHRVDIEEHRARCVRRIGIEALASRQLPDEPCVDGAHQQVATRGSLSGTLCVVEQPFHATGREVGVNHQTALLLNHRCLTGLT